MAMPTQAAAKWNNRSSKSGTLTFVGLMHEDQIDMLEAVKCVQPLRRCCHARYGVEGEQCLAGEVVGRQHVVIHYGKQKHGRLLATLFQCDGAAAEQLQRAR